MTVISTNIVKNSATIYPIGLIFVVDIPRYSLHVYTKRRDKGLKGRALSDRWNSKKSNFYHICFFPRFNGRSQLDLTTYRHAVWCPIRQYSQQCPHQTLATSIEWLPATGWRGLRGMVSRQARGRLAVTSRNTLQSAAGIHSMVWTNFFGLNNAVYILYMDTRQLSISVFFFK